MRTAVVGIDLGTTNSVIAIPGQFPDQGVVFGNITVIWDELERLTHASAVCEVDGETALGNDAKQLAAEGHAPVRFVKKYMGTTHSSRVGSRELLPEAISSMVLKHLCAFAEKSLNIKIVGAVITHPAYFDGLAIDATRKAGEQAGLKVHGLLMEPMAAAMAYCAENPLPTLRVLVYDLGGGTFDVTLMERSGVAFTPIGFGGNRELGGYNFDKAIALKMLATLRDKGYRLTIDPAAPERDPRWATLMHYGERMKMELGGPSATNSSVRIPSVFKDDAGKAVQLNFTMTKKDFLELIEPEISETIRETRRVLDGAGIAADQVDLLVLVGGSCRIHAIQERLKQEFGLDPQYDEDVLDLSVAVGAAMVAATAGVSEDGVILAPVPERTPEATIEITGQVEATAKRASVANLTTTVTGGASGVQRTMTNVEGRFYVEVELVPNADNQVTVAISTPQGEELFAREFTVTHNAEMRSSLLEKPPPILPKAISVLTETGFRVAAAEGAALPFKDSQSFQTIAELTEIPIDLFQEDIQLTTIHLKGFSKPVPAGCRVEIEVEIGEDYVMKATAFIPSANIRKTQEVQLKPLDIPDLDKLRSDYAQVKSQFLTQLQNTPEGRQRAKIGAEGDLIIEELDKLLDAEFPERFQAYLLTKKLFLLAKQLGTAANLTPAKPEMDAKFAEIEELLPKAIAKKSSLADQKIDKTVATLKQEADRAYQQSIPEVWAQVARKVDEIIADLTRLVRDADTGGADAIPAMMLGAYVQQEIDEVRAQVRERLQAKSLSGENAARCVKELDAAQQKLDRIDMSNEQAAKQQLRSLYQQHVLTAKKISGVTTTGQGPVIR